MPGEVDKRCKGTRDGGIEIMCNWLKQWIQPPGSVKGIKRLMLFNKKTGAMRSLVVYGANRQQDILFNFCPFCGGQIAEHNEEPSCPKT